MFDICHLLLMKLTLYPTESLILAISVAFLTEGYVDLSGLDRLGIVLVGFDCSIQT